MLYCIGRSGGEALVRRRFVGPRMARSLDLSKQYGVLAIAVPAVLPAPFKIFVLLAGVTPVSVWRLAITVALARGFRCFAVGALSVCYGDDAIAFIEANGRAVALVLVELIVADGLVSCPGIRAIPWIGADGLHSTADRYRITTVP